MGPRRLVQHLRRGGRHSELIVPSQARAVVTSRTIWTVPNLADAANCLPAGEVSTASGAGASCCLQMALGGPGAVSAAHLATKNRNSYLA
jgi:hypothetical protein